MARTSLAVLFLVAAAAGLANAASASLNGWYSCSEETFWHPTESSKRRLREAVAPFGTPPVPGGAQCGQYSVPLCHEDVCNSTDRIQVFVKRLVGQAATPKILWVLQGGPGASSVNMEPVMVELYHRLNQQVTIMTMDHRGTGRSNRLECVAAQAMESGSPSGSWVDDDELPECIRDIHTRYGHPEAFSVTSAALDLVAVIAADQSANEVFLYGVSYGTLWLERFVVVQPRSMTNVHGFVLDGIVPHDGARRLYMHDWDTNMDAVGRKFLGLCNADKYCRSQFPASTSVTDILRDLYKKSHPSAAYIKDVLGGPYGLKVVLSYLLVRSTMRLLIPVLVHRLHRGTPADLDVATYLLDTIDDILMGRTQFNSASYDSELLYSTVVFSELWKHPSPSEASIQQTFVDGMFGYGVGWMYPAYCTYTNDSSRDCDQYRRNVSFTYPLDKYANQKVVARAEASILVLNGGLDAQTPLEYAQAQYDAIEGSKKLIVFPTAPHAITYVTWLQRQPANPTTCGVLLVASYVEVGGKLNRLDTSCTANTRPLTFDIPPRLTQAFPQVTGGLFDGSLVNQATSAPANATSPVEPPQSTVQATTAAPLDDDDQVASTSPPTRDQDVLTLAPSTTATQGSVVVGNAPATTAAAVVASTNMAESMVGLLACLLVVTGIVAVKYFVEAKKLRNTHVPLADETA